MSAANMKPTAGMTPAEPGSVHPPPAKAEIRRSLGQIAVTVPLYLGLWTCMYFSLTVSYALTLALAIPAAGLVVRIFIFQHDCGHGSFFRDRWANDLLGRVCSLFTLTPYAIWRHQHAQHHANWNNLDRRQSGLDIYSTCLTIAEYDTPPRWKKERRGVHLTNLALVAAYGSLGLLIGFWQVLLIQVPVSSLAAIVGVWLFSVQHKFENTLWLHGPEWNATDAALRGSSYLRLPRVLQWFTGNIGFHHVHHFDPRIPNYHLQEQHNRTPAFQQAPMLSLWAALRAYRYCLWDEGQRKMVPIPKGAVPA